MKTKNSSWGLGGHWSPCCRDTRSSDTVRLGLAQGHQAARAGCDFWESHRAPVGVSCVCCSGRRRQILEGKDQAAEGKCLFCRASAVALPEARIAQALWAEENFCLV